MTRQPLSSADRDALIAQATSAGHCWFVVCVGAALAIFAGVIHIG
jgi:hypothetical protein